MSEQPGSLLLEVGGADQMDANVGSPIEEMVDAAAVATETGLDMPESDALTRPEYQADEEMHKKFKEIVANLETGEKVKEDELPRAKGEVGADRKFGRIF